MIVPSFGLCVWYNQVVNWLVTIGHVMHACLNNTGPLDSPIFPFYVLGRHSIWTIRTVMILSLSLPIFPFYMLGDTAYGQSELLWFWVWVCLASHCMCWGDTAYGQSELLWFWVWVCLASHFMCWGDTAYGQSELLWFWVWVCLASHCMCWGDTAYGQSELLWFWVWVCLSSHCMCWGDTAYGQSELLWFWVWVCLESSFKQPNMFVCIILNAFLSCSLLLNNMIISVFKIDHLFWYIKVPIIKQMNSIHAVKNHSRAISVTTAIKVWKSR